MLIYIIECRDKETKKGDKNRRLNKVKTVILCGGQGTRLQEATGGLMPKPMVEIGEKPMLWHIMKGYAHFGIKDFVLCLGHLGNVVKKYFLHFEALNSDFTIKLGSSGECVFHKSHHCFDWNVTLAETGLQTMTGARVAKIKRYVGDETFLLTYGDGVADVDIKRLVEFHKEHGKIATITGVNPIGRFGKLSVVGTKVYAFEEKPASGAGGRINGGFFVFNSGIFDYVCFDDNCILEREPLEKLARNGELMMYAHDGFWQCMDTLRDLMLLRKLWDTGKPPWRVWETE
ncbi:MAG: glucose-1-phosphate cytidylyltransferase [Planctomycetota bacterium]